ncbi:MAG: protein-methionine-sulfoxide reductase heme-binding subunit MsrQ [Steroidobacteraceae bacterium]
MTDTTRRLLKWLVFVACLGPVMYLTLGVFGLSGISLGADPVHEILHTCGNWALKFLLVTLAMTPLRELSHSIFWLRLRRMLGLFAFFYGILHVTVYIVLDQSGHLGAVWQDVVKRPYITIGMLALLLLIPLAATSTASMQRRLGRRWTNLHRLIYGIAVLGVWHYWWGVKKDIREPLAFACLLTVLLAYRIYGRYRAKSRVREGAILTRA